MAFPGRKQYCVFGCTELGAYMHRFPHPERRAELFMKWISIVGDKLKQTDANKIYKNRRVCDHHFTWYQKVAGHRLTKSAVPTLHLNGVLLSPGISVQLEHNYKSRKLKFITTLIRIKSKILPPFQYLLNSSSILRDYGLR